MKKRIRCFLFLLICIFAAGLPVSARELRVRDDADLLTTEEETKLEQDIEQLSGELDLDIIIVTTSETGGKRSKQYADDYYDNNNFGPWAAEQYSSGILYLIDLDNGEIYISADTENEFRFTDSETDRMLDRVLEKAQSSGYYDSCRTFLAEVEVYGSLSSDNGIERKELGPVQKIIISFLISLGVGGVSVLVLNLKGKIRFRPGGRTYQNEQGLRVLFQRDKYLTTTMTSRQIQRQSPSSGSSGSRTTTTHRSSSGRSHSGGGRKL